MLGTAVYPNLPLAPIEMSCCCNLLRVLLINMLICLGRGESIPKMRHLTRLIKNRSAKLQDLKLELDEIHFTRRERGKFFNVAGEIDIKQKCKALRIELSALRRELDKIKLVDDVDKERKLKECQERRMRKDFLERTERKIEALVSRTLAERQEIGRYVEAIEDDRRRCRILMMECDFMKRRGKVEGFVVLSALQAAHKRIDKIKHFPIKMRLTIEKMELAHLRKRIAATAELC